MKINRFLLGIGEKNGFTLLELLITLTIFVLVIALGVPGFQSFIRKVEINNGLRTVTLALNSARYKAVENNRSVKLIVADNKLLLMERRNNNWESFLDFDPGEAITLSINASPVFSPEGYVAPLCSILVLGHGTSYRITLSIAGRIKVVEL